MIKVMNRCFGIFLFCFCLLVGGQEHPGSLPAFAEGERLFAEGSYQLALKAYNSLSSNEGAAEISFWIDYRRLDCEWRSLAGSGRMEAKLSKKIGNALERLLEDFESLDVEVDFLQMQATMYESAGDFWWRTRQRGYWSKAWKHYEKALNLWASSSDVNLARERYLAIVWTATYSSGGS